MGSEVALFIAHLMRRADAAEIRRRACRSGAGLVLGLDDDLIDRGDVSHAALILRSKNRTPDRRA